MRARGPWGAIATVLAFLASGWAALGSTDVPDAASSVTAFAPDLILTPNQFLIDHFVFVVMENHAYDNYFGTYCLQAGPICDFPANGIPPGACEPTNPANPTAGCIVPFRFGKQNVSAPMDLPHHWASSHQAYDFGRMDGFYQAHWKKLSTYGYYDGSLLPTYWDWAEQYAVGDGFFSSALSYSLPNHWYMMAGQAPDESEQHMLQVPANSTRMSSSQSLYLNESNATRAISDVMENTTVSWTYYDWSLPTYARALQHRGPGPGSPYDYWNPLAAKAESYTPAFKSHFTGVPQFFADAAAGELPNASWVIPAFNQSDHAPSSLYQGEIFVSQILNAVEKSPDWNRTAVFVTWDDYGGFWDHVPPPAMDVNGLSFRVPLIVVSPYTPPAYVSHQFGYFESFIKLLEWKFNLPPITYRDASAPVLLSFFAYQSKPRPPMTEPANPMALTYPQPLQKLDPPSGVATFKATPIVNGVLLKWTGWWDGSPRAGWKLDYGPTASTNRTTVSIDHDVGIFRLQGLTAGQSYTFTLRSFAGGAVSASSSLVATPLSSPHAPLTVLQMPHDPAKQRVMAGVEGAERDPGGT